MCKVFGIPRSSYYKHIKKVDSKRSLENKRRYGAPKIHKKLKEQGEIII
jgi:hypothetical protein